MFGVSLLACAVLVVLLLRYYFKAKNKICKSNKKLNGRTAIVTGGTSGIGLEMALDFARRGARVIIACPFRDEGISAERKIIETTGNKNVTFKFLDLASLKSVREFANHILENEDRLDLLMNNAGVGIPGDYLTEDGLSFIMQVNYYGHFLLTVLLLPLLMKTGRPNDNSRIVNTTSLTRYLSSFDVDSYDKIGYWMRLRIYANSKVSLILFSSELTKRISSFNVVVNNADPGLVSTRIYDSSNIIGGFLARMLCKLFFKVPFEGAQTAIHAALDEDSGLVSGQIFDHCKLIDKGSYSNNEAERKLWKRSIEAVKLEDDNLKILVL